MIERILTKARVISGRQPYDARSGGTGSLGRFCPVRLLPKNSATGRRALSSSCVGVSASGARHSCGNAHLRCRHHRPLLAVIGHR